MQGANHDGLRAFDRFGKCSERGDVGFRIQQDNPTSLYEEFAYLSARAVHANESALARGWSLQVGSIGWTWHQRHL